MNTAAHLLRLLLLLVVQAGIAAQAHLMVAQRGTLNIVGSGAFVVMAVPATALRGVDDDGDDLMSMAEMRRHARAIEQQVQNGLQLFDPNGQRPLEGLMLSLSPDDRSPSAPARHLVLLGRFALATDAPGPLRLRFALFGQDADTQSQQITITRGADQQVLILSSKHSEAALLPSAAQVFYNYAVLGAEHIVLGLDHLLFLLGVLAAGWRMRQLMLALTAFTAGHALTLALSIMAGITASPAWVEPAIALTIIAMAAFDVHARRTAKTPSLSWRIALVFTCALIHGLALGNALSEAGLDGRHLWVSLGGFNLGIEVAQLGIALLATGLIAAGTRFTPRMPMQAIAPMMSFTAMGMVGFWLIQRLGGG